MMTGQLSRGLATLAGRFASNGMPLRPLATSASGVSGTRKSPRGTRPSPLQPLKFVAAEETVPDHVEEALFSPENVEGMTAVEIARMRVVYGFVKEHADVVEKKLAPVDPAANPLIDERSFETLQTLPKLPDVALQQFRKDLPAKAADEANALSTRSAWEPVARDDRTPEQQKSSDAELEALVGARADVSAWRAVDERTMDPHYFARMQRQRIQQAGFRGDGSAMASPVASAGVHAVAGARPATKRRCRLSDRRGRVSVDYREVGVLGEFLNDHGKVLERRKSGLTAKAQRKVARAVKSSRQMALLHPEPQPGLSLKEMDDMAAAVRLQQ